MASTNTFNPGQWQRNAALTLRDEVEIVTSRIEAAGLDIAPAYNDWRDLGFALAAGLGEEGRSFYHRLSRFYAGYRPAETDKQYNACLRSHGQGITVNTFFHLARLAGADIRTSRPAAMGADVPAGPPPSAPSSAARPVSPLPNCQIATSPAAEGVASLPTAGKGNASASAASASFLFPDDIYTSLPRLLTDACSYALSDADRGMLLLGSLTVLSSCLTHVSGIYGQRRVYPNLYLFVSAPASAGKGRLTLCRHLVDVVHADLRRRNRQEWEEYRHQKALYDKNRRKEGGEEPLPPPVRMLFIPANSSATALFQTLNDNEGQALMFETEGDTLTTTFRSEHGNYSDGLRKAFHHEPITYNRRKDREYVEITAPRLSVLLSGTPRQIGALIPDAENGLFSRFLFYCLPLSPTWNDVFAQNGDDTLDSRFLSLGARFFAFYTRLQRAGHLTFQLTDGQQSAFNRFFADLQQQGLGDKGADMLPSVRRLGLSTYRICMVLSALRLMDYEGDVPLPATICCRDEDFRTALSMARMLLRHTEAAYDSLQAALPAATASSASSAPSASPLASTQCERRRQALLQALPATFDRAFYQSAAAAEGIPARTADRYIGELCARGVLKKLGHDSYGKEEEKAK